MSHVLSCAKILGPICVSHSPLALERVLGLFPRVIYVQAIHGPAGYAAHWGLGWLIHGVGLVWIIYRDVD